MIVNQRHGLRSTLGPNSPDLELPGEKLPNPTTRGFPVTLAKGSLAYQESPFLPSESAVVGRPDLARGGVQATVLGI